MSDSGRPMWLFKLPRFRITRYFAPRNSAVTSFVVVLPALPVMATTFVPDACRVERASACNARVVSSTTMTTGSTTPERPPFQSHVRGTTMPPAPAQQLPRDRDVVERQVLVAENLVFLVAFAGDQHHVARTRRLDRFRDGRAAIRNGKRRRVLSSGVRRNAALDLFDDPIRIFVARVVRGDHQDIGQPARDSAHQRAFRPIAIAAAAKQRD